MGWFAAGSRKKVSFFAGSKFLLDHSDQRKDRMHPMASRALKFRDDRLQMRTTTAENADFVRIGHRPSYQQD